MFDNRVQVELPQFNKGLDDRDAPKIVKGPFDLIIYEGWRVGVEGKFRGKSFDLDELNREIDLLVYIDADLNLCKKWKFQSSREECLENGLAWKAENERRLSQKWEAWIGPYAEAHIVPLEAKADFVLSYDEHRVCSLRVRNWSKKSPKVALKWLNVIG